MLDARLVARAQLEAEVLVGAAQERRLSPALGRASARRGATSARAPRRRRRREGVAWWTCEEHQSADLPLGLVLGHRQGDVKRLGADLGRRADLLELAVGLDDRVREAADPLDLDLDDVAGLDRARVRRRAGEQDVAGLERDQPRDVGDLVGEREEQVGAGVALLDLLAVDEGAHGQVGRVDVGGVDQLGPSGQKPSWPLTRSIEPRSMWRKSWTPKSLATV